MIHRVFVPRDSAALAVGANEVARAVGSAAARRGIEVAFDGMDIRI